MSSRLDISICLIEILVIHPFSSSPPVRIISSSHAHTHIVTKVSEPQPGKWIPWFVLWLIYSLSLYQSGRQTGLMERSHLISSVTWWGINRDLDQFCRVQTYVFTGRLPASIHLFDDDEMIKVCFFCIHYLLTQIIYSSTTTLLIGSDAKLNQSLFAALTTLFIYYGRLIRREYN